MANDQFQPNKLFAAFSANELKTLTGWNDILINDYLSIFKSFTSIKDDSDAIWIAIEDLDARLIIVEKKIGNTGSGTPIEEGLEVIEGSVYYRSYISGDVNIKETWAVISGTWTITGFYSEAI